MVISHVSNMNFWKYLIFICGSQRLLKNNNKSQFMQSYDPEPWLCINLLLLKKNKNWEPEILDNSANSY